MNFRKYFNKIVHKKNPIFFLQRLKTFQGRFDIPDGMHIQGVYETQMTTETFSSISNYIESMSIKSNAQVGTSAFEEERKTLDSTTAETFAASASLAASGGGFSLGASFENVQSSGTGKKLYF